MKINELPIFIAFNPGQVKPVHGMSKILIEKSTKFLAWRTTGQRFDKL